MSYDTLRNTLCNELEEFANKGELNTGDLDVIHKLTDTIKNTYKIEMYEDGGYSRGGEWEADMRGAYGRGNSYANRGQHMCAVITAVMARVAVTAREDTAVKEAARKCSTSYR